MAIGERIQFFRLLRGMTQKYLGMSLGFPEKSADVRLAQYETGSRTPKADLTAALAEVLDVSPHALSVPDIDSYVGLMHTLFTLEDNYGLKVTEQDGELALQVDFRKNTNSRVSMIILLLSTTRSMVAFSRLRSKANVRFSPKLDLTAFTVWL